MGGVPIPQSSTAVVGFRDFLLTKRQTVPFGPSLCEVENTVVVLALITFDKTRSSQLKSLARNKLSN